MPSLTSEVYYSGQTWQLIQLRLSKGSCDGVWDVKVGRFGKGEDFNTFPCEFQHHAFWAAHAANWAGSVWYNWPVSQCAIHLKYQISSEVFGGAGRSHPLSGWGTSHDSRHDAWVVAQ